MNRHILKQNLSFTKTIVLGLVLSGLVMSGCGVYFNTFFNAKKAFNSGEKVREQSRNGRGGKSDYTKAIEKARKVVENFPNSKYYDDALFILGVSYFHTEQYSKAERRLRELLANYDDPKFTREARLYLAKTKLELNEIDNAMEIFEEIFQSDASKGFKAEAAIGLGTFQYENSNWRACRGYFMSVRDSLGSDNQKFNAQKMLADSYYEAFQFEDALGGYLQLIGMDPDKDDYFHAMYRAAISSYRMFKIADGMDYLKELSEDELYYDSIPMLKLTIAEGYEREDDLELAIITYDDVAATADKKQHQASAYYHLALIYQYDYDQLSEAKEYYDKASRANRGGEEGRDAIKRSSAIGKIEKYETKFERDSTTTQKDIDDAAYTQYQLSELYWFDLNKPDTAILEMQYLIDSFSTSYDAPRAMVAISQMYRDHLKDNSTADSILRLSLQLYPTSDYASEALELLGLLGTAADTGYAAVYLEQAERWLVDSLNYDSAIYYYQYVADNFPDSKFFLQAQFNVIWVTENHRHPGDSSVYFAYQEFADSFPGTPFALLARNIIKEKPKQHRRPDKSQEGEDIVEDEDNTAVAQQIDSGYVDPRESLYVGPGGEELGDFKGSPTQIEIKFEFPTSAYGMQDDAIYLYFQILVDFSGKVIDIVLKIPSEWEEINELAIESIGSMTFDAMEINDLVSRMQLDESNDGRGYWLVYKYLVKKPNFLR